jgi:hypothetical protein
MEACIHEVLNVDGAPHSPIGITLNSDLSYGAPHSPIGKFEIYFKVATRRCEGRLWHVFLSHPDLVETIQQVDFGEVFGTIDACKQTRYAG